MQQSLNEADRINQPWLMCLSINSLHDNLVPLDLFVQAMLETTAA